MKRFRCDDENGQSQFYFSVFFCASFVSFKLERTSCWQTYAVTHIYCVKPNWNGFQSLRSLKCDQFQFDRSQCDFSEEKRRKKVIKSKSNVSTSESFNCELTNETMTKCSIRASHVIVTNMKRQRKNVDTILGPRIRREICSKWKWIIHLWHIFLFLLYNSQSTALIAIAVVVVIVV